jgi:hypothetical protein
MGTLLGMKLSDIEKVVYYARHVVLEDWKDGDGKVKYKARQLLTDRGTTRPKKRPKAKWRWASAPAPFASCWKKSTSKKTRPKSAPN